MPKFCVVDQWHSMAETWAELADEAQHKGDAAQVDKLWKFKLPELLDAPPAGLWKGTVCLRVEDSGELTVHSSNYDSSD